jgi:isopenicillin N synthase-like dioxygenase
MATRAVPVIDIAPFYSNDPEQKKIVAEEIGKACAEVGFFYIKGHKVDKTIIKKIWNVSGEYFDLPVEEKKIIPLTIEYPYGYVGLQTESLSQTLNLKSQPDLKESFAICIGPTKPAPTMITPRWPERPEGFKETWINYYREMEILSNDLLTLFALSLHLPEKWFEDKTNEHICALRALNYPHQTVDPSENQFRASAHTDWGTITLLLIDDSPGGLQVYNKNGTWQDVKSIPDTFVVNLGDLMSMWTNDNWLSTLHRVVNPKRDETHPNTRRQSIVFFHNLNYDAKVETIPTCYGETNPKKYPTVIAGEHLFAKNTAANTGVKKY